MREIKEQTGEQPEKTRGEREEQPKGTRGERAEQPKRTRGRAAKKSTQIIIRREFVGTKTVAEAFIPVIAEDIRRTIAARDTEMVSESAAESEV